jgi:hypothetical protein
MHLEPSDKNARRLFERGIEGPVTMLNLLRFREEADYAELPQLAPPSPISGRAAYDLYVRHTLPDGSEREPIASQTRSELIQRASAGWRIKAA